MQPQLLIQVQGYTDGYSFSNVPAIVFNYFTESRRRKINSKIYSRRMGGSRIFYWEGPRIVKVRDDGRNVAPFALKSWLIGGAMALWPPPLEPPMGTINYES